MVSHLILRSAASVAVLILVLAYHSDRSIGQTIDPYRRLTDPRAITDLEGPDTEPLKYRCAVGWPSEMDVSDGYYIVAKGEGAGILTHMWMQLQDRPDSVAEIKIYIDDSLIAHNYLYHFFKRPSGAWRPPFDSIQSGALVCDVQMGFKKNFKITYNANYNNCCLFWAVGWRPVLDPVLVEVFSKDPTPQADARQKAAEEVYWSGDSPWKDAPVQTFAIDEQLAPSGSIEQEINGPGMITEMHIKPSSYDVETLRNIRLQMYWDGSPYPSVDVPLADFFGAGAGMRDVRSHPIRTQKEGMLTSYFPMPFAVHGKIRLMNNSANTIGCAVSIKFSSEPVDRKRTGYFEAQFNEKKALRYHVFHPVGYHQGRGRFVGMQLYLPTWEPGYFLEGDPFFHIDSNGENFIRYTGTEDYFNGGWFFSDGPFSLPFAGCTEIHTSLYRFHYMDAIDFKKSFELNVQHGSRNDFKAWYRTIGYFYNEWTPYWCSRDTVRHGEDVTIAGSGYAPGEDINVQLDDLTFASTSADANGEFTVTKTLDATTRIGGRILSVNGYARPKPLWIVDGPDIYFVRDTFPAYVNWKDTIMVYGTGFPANSKVTLSLDTTLMITNSDIVTDASGRFKAQAYIPYLADGDYHVVAQTDALNKAVSSATLHYTRTLNLEIENMWPPLLQDGFARQDYMGYYPDNWSEQYYLLFITDPGKRLAVKFSVPISDTFEVTTYATRGARFGDYDITLDNFAPVTFFGYEDREITDPARSGPVALGTHFLAAGDHYLTFTCVGKDDRTSEYLLGADNLVLRPTTSYQPLPASAAPTPVVALEPFVAYPNPVEKVLKLFVSVDSADRLISAEVVDALGIARQTYYPVHVSSDGVIELHVGDLTPGHYHLLLKEANKSIGITGFVKF